MPSTDEDFLSCHYTELCESFLNGNKNLSPLTKGTKVSKSGLISENARLNDLVAILLDQIDDSEGDALPQKARLARANAILIAIGRAPEDAAKRRADLLMRRIVQRLNRSSDTHWLVAFLGCRLEEVHALTTELGSERDLRLQFDPTSPLDDYKSRYRFSAASEANSYAMIGSTLLTANKEEQDGPHVLTTALITKQTKNTSGELTGMVMVIADFSRTTSSEFTRSQAAKAANLAAVLGCRYAAACKDVNEFNRNHRSIFAYTGTEIAKRTGFDSDKSQKKANIMMVRIFEYGNDYQISAANFGNNTLFIWYPDDKQMQPIVPGSGNTLDIFELCIPQGCILIPVSNNIVDYLSEIKEKNFKGDPHNPVDVIAHLRNLAFAAQNAKMKQDPPSLTIGGDFVLSATELPMQDARPYYFDYRTGAHLRLKADADAPMRDYLTYDSSLNYGAAVSKGASERCGVFISAGQVSDMATLSIKEQKQSLSEMHKALMLYNGFSQIFAIMIDSKNILYANNSNGLLCIVNYDTKRQIQSCQFYGKSVPDVGASSSRSDYTPSSLPLASCLKDNCKAIIMMLSPGFLGCDLNAPDTFQTELQKLFDIIERDNLPSVREHELARDFSRLALTLGATDVAVNVVQLNLNALAGKDALALSLFAGSRLAQPASQRCIATLQSQVNGILQPRPDSPNNLDNDGVEKVPDSP